MNIRYELMYQYICHQEEKEKNKLLQDLEKTGDRLDIQAKLFLLDVIFMKFRFMQQEDNEKTNFFVQYVCDGDTLLTTEYSGEFSCYEYSPAEILKHAVVLASAFGITASTYSDNYATYYNFSVNLLDEKQTRQGHTQTILQRGKRS